MNNRNTSIQNTTKAVHNETVRIVDAQIRDMAVQMADLDQFVTRAREENGRHHNSQCESLKSLSTNARQTFDSVDDMLQATSARTQSHNAACKDGISCLEKGLSPFAQSVQTRLAELVTNSGSNPMMEYVVTGGTPQKKDWSYPKSLPRTEGRDVLLSKLRNSAGVKPAAARSPGKTAFSRKMASPRKGFSSPSKLPSPTKTKVFHDDPASADQGALPFPRLDEPIEEIKGGLREVDMNVLAHSSSVDDAHGHHAQTSYVKSMNNMQQQHQQPPLKRHATAESRLPRKGRENSVLSQSVGPSFGTARRLRSSPHQ